MLIDDHKEAQSVDKVLFCVTGPATEVYINDIYADTIYLYADDKKCYDTYILMAEVCNVLHVVAIFYSNPGIYISLSYQSSS